MGCKFGKECSFPHLKIEEEPNKKPKNGGDKSAVAKVKHVRQLGCAFQDTEPAEASAILRKGPKVLGPIRRVRFTRTALRQANILENKGPSLNQIQVKVPHQRSSYAVKFEDRSQERLQDKSDAPAARHGILPEIFYKLKEKDKATLCSPTEEWIMPAASVVDSGASMHMVSKRDLNSADLETMRISKSPTTVMTANGKVQTREEATVHVKESDLCVTVMLVEETSTVLSLGKLIEEFGYTYH